MDKRGVEHFGTEFVLSKGLGGKITTPKERRLPWKPKPN
jgi:hypothetical protein